MPLTATGRGLPSNLLNNLLVEPDGTVVAATDGGLAFGKPASPAGHSAADWTFLRGQDFLAKVRGLWHPPQHWQAPSPEVLNALPMEDYTTAVAFTEQRSMTNDQEIGRTHSSSQLLASNSSSVAAGYRLQGTGYTYLWIGHRRRGIDVWEYNQAGKLIKRWQIHGPQIGNDVTALLPLPGGAMAVGTYGNGVSIVMLRGARNFWKHTSKGNKNAPAISEPRGARPPTQEQLTALYQDLLKNNIPSRRVGTGPQVSPTIDDWRTQGSWLGRYGRYWACLFAFFPPRVLAIMSGHLDRWHWTTMRESAPIIGRMTVGRIIFRRAIRFGTT
jgi:hypothetical protein